jgi:multicomponent Na+:H+ antiporter subunit F
MSYVIAVCLAGVGLAAVLAVAKVLRADTFVDRIIALDVLLGVIVTGTAVGAAGTGDGILLNLLVVTGLLGFVGTCTVARFVERRGI